MPQAIETKYMGPTDTKGSRVKATCQAGSVTLHWDDALNQINNHKAAAKALADKLGWHCEWIGGAGPSNTRGFVFVPADSADRFTSEG